MVTVKESCVHTHFQIQERSGNIACSLAFLTEKDFLTMSTQTIRRGTGGEGREDYLRMRQDVLQIGNDERYGQLPCSFDGPSKYRGSYHL